MKKHTKKIMGRKPQDVALVVIMLLLGFIVAVALAVKVVDFVDGIRDLERQVETNKAVIEQQQRELDAAREPCTPEDVRDPQLSPGCTDQRGSDNPGQPDNPPTPSSRAPAGNGFGGGGASTPGQAAPQQQPTPTTPTPETPQPESPKPAEVLGIPVCVPLTGICVTR